MAFGGDSRGFCVMKQGSGESEKTEKRKQSGAHYAAAGSPAAFCAWCFITLLCSLVSFYEIEWINNLYLHKMAIRYHLLGIAITFVLYLVLILLFNSPRIGLIAGQIVFLLWGCTNYFVQEFRGIPFQWIDFGSLGVAFSVSGNYRYELSRPMWMSIACSAVIVIALLASKVRGVKRGAAGHILTRAAGAVLLICFYGLIFKTDFLASQGVWLRDWQPWYTYRLFGMETGFLAFAKASFPSAPDGFSEGRVKEVIAAAEGSDPAGFNETEPPENLIVVMNESFSDLSIYPGFSCSKSILTNFNSLEEETISGKLLVSVKGGTTANTEYEFLTGNSCVLSPSTVVYNSFIKDDQYSLVRILKACGYRTLAMHPYGQYGWNRNVVYPRMGFDAFLHIDNSFQGAETVRGMVSDRGDYEELIRQVENKKDGEKLFIFNVTMQNHSSYKNESFKSTVQVDGFEGKNKGQAEQYLSLIRISDQALGELISYFEESDERTMICFFGDHQPEIGEDFWEYCYGGREEDQSFADQQKAFMTRWFIWANYEIPTAKEVPMSANYLGAYLMKTAGIPLSGYQKFLLQMREQIPAMNAYGYFSPDGTAAAWGEEENSPEERKLLDYKTLIYSELTDGETRDSTFFGISEK
ncbi:MAG: LTA synthase family protein [Lachnospiraceae bacterium]|nr:LTA synthase family protein [Lachnospiraceae bacterium]